MLSFLRWSWRDLRARWPQVVAIALIIGVGSGVYSGLSSATPWRQATYDASYAQLGMYDLRVAFDDDVYVDQARLQEVVDGVGAGTAPDGGDGSIAASRPRLRVPTQVDASTDDTTVLVPGELVSVGVDAGSGAGLNGLDVQTGRALGAEDAAAGATTVAIDEHFADEYGLRVPREVTLGGGERVRVVARVLSPEYFMIMGRDGGLLAQANHAVVFASLPTVQRLSGREGQVNDMLVDLAPGADSDRVAAALEEAVGAAFPQSPFTVMEPTDDPVRTLMYDDIGGDQRFFSIFAVMVLFGAAFAAFNLVGRILTAQRREFGIGMAMGVPTSRMAVRPVLFGAQVALGGAVAGVALGLILQHVLGSLWQSLMPMPVWITDFQPAVFLRGAALGFVIPLLACILPLRQTLRMAPVDAIRTTHRTPGGGLSRWLVHLPGSTITQMPFRNVLRAPRRTGLTALGIAAAIAVLVGVMGLIDSFMATIDRGEADILGASPDRVSIDLDFFYPADGPVVAGATDQALVTDAETGLRLPGQLGTGDDAFDVLIQTTDFSSDLWRPDVLSGDLAEDRPGVVISDKAARDLGVGVGDQVSLRHPVREGLGYRFERTELPVLAVHANPYRFLVYLDDGKAGLFGLDGITERGSGRSGRLGGRGAAGDVHQGRRGVGAAGVQVRVVDPGPAGGDDRPVRRGAGDGAAADLLIVSTPRPSTWMSGPASTPPCSPSGCRSAGWSGPRWWRPPSPGCSAP